MIKILYIVSTLQSSGPTTQLFNLIKNLDRSKFTPYLLTLSPEPLDSKWDDFQNIGVSLFSLNLTRLNGLIFARRRLDEYIKRFVPDVIHTQGIRADSLMASIKAEAEWVMTSRNFPSEDYPAKFGRLKGVLMALKHLSTMRRCKNVVSCSKSIQRQLSSVGVNSYAIQNGVRNIVGNPTNLSDSIVSNAPVFISVGSLISRKNMKLLLLAFDLYLKENTGSLIICGDGPLKESLQSLGIQNVHFVGNVDNVPDYLAAADFFVSASLSEGLPNTVLEALSAGLPVILSDIESHKEIAFECQDACKVFELKGGAEALARSMKTALSVFDSQSRSEALNAVTGRFSALKMSQQYQSLYLKLMESR